jgi:hypothetical protein
MSQTSLASLATQCLGDDQNPHIVEFVEHLLGLACACGEVTGRFADHQHLLFAAAGQGPCLVELTRARAKLRALCARLGILCNQGSGNEVSLYGGEATFPYAVPGGLPVSLSVSFKNTPDEQRFQIRWGRAIANSERPAAGKPDR